MYLCLRRVGSKLEYPVERYSSRDPNHAKGQYSRSALPIPDYRPVRNRSWGCAVTVNCFVLCHASYENAQVFIRKVSKNRAASITSENLVEIIEFPAPIECAFNFWVQSVTQPKSPVPDSIPT